MNKMLALIGSTVLLVGASLSQAAPILHHFTPDAPIILTNNNPFSYQHKLEGYDTLTHSLTSATIQLAISGADGQNIAINFGSMLAFSGKLKDLPLGQLLEFDISQLQPEGLLNVTLTKLGPGSSTFSFSGSTLVAEPALTVQLPGTDSSTIPTPGTLMLLGAGLIGTMLVRRRRQTA